MDSKDVDDMFSSLGEKLGWFQFEDIDSTLKFLNSKSAKKKTNGKRDTKTKKDKTKEIKAVKKNPSAFSSIEKPGEIEDCTSSTRNSSSSTSIATTNVADLKEEVSGHFILEKNDCKEINYGFPNNTSVVGKELAYQEKARALREKCNISSPSSVVTQIKEDSFDVNLSVGHRLSLNTFSDVSDESIANITSGICKKIQFNSDDSSSLLDSRLEKSTRSENSSCLGESFERKSSSEKADSAFSPSDEGNNHSRSSDLFCSSSKLDNDTEDIKKKNDFFNESDDDDGSENDLENFIQEMQTPHKTSVNDSTNKQSEISDFSTTEHQKNLEDLSYYNSSCNKENNEVFKKHTHVTSNKNNDRSNKKKNVCSPSAISKPNQKLVLRDKNALSNSSSQSENSSSDDDFEAFLEKMKKPIKETPQWLPESMKEFIVSSSDESSEEDDEESLLLYHRTRAISPEINKSSLFGTPKSRYIQKPRIHNRGSFNDDKNDRNKDKTVVPFLTPKIESSIEVFKKPNNFPQTEIKKVPKIKPPSTPKGMSTSNLQNHNWTCPNLKSSEFIQKSNTQQSTQGYASFLKSLSVGIAINSVDPNIQKYIKHFKKYQVELVSKLFKIYNETVFDNQFPTDFSIHWNKRLLTTAGHCILKTKYTSNRKESKRSAEICLATKVCDTPERVRDTLIHEMCHAAVWVFNGSREGHGRLWKTWAWKANRAHPYLPVIKRCHSYDIAKKYTYRCVQCGYSFGRHSKSLDTAKKVCGYCRGRFELLLPNTPSGTPNSTPARTPSKFALFVKENYGTVKKAEKCSHKDVMEKLSAQFKQAKIGSDL